MEKNIPARRGGTRALLLHILWYVAAAVLVAFFSAPFVMLFLRSIMPDDEVLRLPIRLLPSHPYWGAYRLALDADLLRYTLNTLVVLVANIVVIPFMAAFCAFGFARLNTWGKNFWFALLLATLMMPAITVQIPMYSIYKKLGLINTLGALIVPAVFGGGAINIFLIRQFIRGIPGELDNAAKMDGANVFRIFFTIYLPLLRPILVYVAVTTFLGLWNDFMTPLLYLNKESVYTLAVGIYYKFAGEYNPENWPNIQMATGVILMIPCVVLFFAFQRQLIDGVAVTGMKG